MRFLGIIAVFAGVVMTIPGDPPSSEWVYRGTGGKLVYKTTPAGDRILDFSHAGYMGGGVALPDVPVRLTVRPSGSDDTDAIQAAIDEVAARRPDGEFRGAVLLEPGIFRIGRTLRVSASGVVLRGSGSQGDARSTLKLLGESFLAIAVRSVNGQRESGRAGVESADGKTTIRDTYVPAGSKTFDVFDAAGFTVGDLITIGKPVTERWVEYMQMHDLVRDGRKQTWLPTSRVLTTERTIAAISGNTITLDVPLSDSYEAKYLDPPGTVVARIDPPDRITQAGIEYLHIEAPVQAISHSKPHFTAVRLNGEDCWIRDVVIDETMNSVGIGGKRITVERVIITREALHEGASRPAEFSPNGTQVLIDRCEVDAENVWFVGTGSGHAGPIVILNCEFRGDSRAESHQRWSTGMLYDNVTAPEGGVDFRNRGSMGSGHGLSMGWGVAWNCVAKDFVIQQPPGVHNWMIGCIGVSRPEPRPFGSGPNLPEGTRDSHGVHVTPQSLYLAQLAERLGPQAVKNIGY